MGKFYLNTQSKLSISLTIATIWLGFSYYVANSWILDLSTVLHPIVSYMLIFGIALLPGFFNAYLLTSLILDNRPKIKKQYYSNMPAITILIAAYNEETNITDTLESIFKQTYDGDVEVIVCDDGSLDATAQLVNEYYKIPSPGNVTKKLLTGVPNAGKSSALNRGLKEASNDLIITIDADSCLFKDALNNIVGNYLSGPSNTAAVAGTVLVRNSRTSWLTKAQEWEYFIALSLVKRSQSLHQGTLVAQGAFSLYQKDVLEKLGGWSNVVGEDIVLTWGIQGLGLRVGHAENAIVFTNVPETYGVFYKQRERWSRGLIEAFKRYPETIWQLKQNTPFVWFNLLFPFLDFTFLFGFVPGLIAALCFGWYHIVSLWTLLLLPMAITINYCIYRVHVKTFEEMNLKVRKNYIGFFLFMLAYQIMLTPACLRGYFDEFFNIKKSWGTKNYGKRKRNSLLMKLWYSIVCGIIVCSLIVYPLIVFGSDDINGRYDYQWDSEGYRSHQENARLHKDTWYFDQTYFIAHERQTTYNFNSGLVLKEFNGNVFDKYWRIIAGPGVLDTSIGNIQPIYRFNAFVKTTDKSNIEFNAERIPQMNANARGDITFNTITDNIIDSYMLTGDYQITKDLSVVGGVFSHQISDGNSRNGFLFKEIYNINDNWLIQGRHRLYWFDETSPLYFSPTEYQQHWLMLTYVQPFFEDNAVLKLSAGPGITKINNRTEVTRIYEVQLKANFDGVKPEVHYNCFTAVYGYENCTVGASINIPF